MSDKNNSDANTKNTTVDQTSDSEPLDQQVDSSPQNDNPLQITNIDDSDLISETPRLTRAKSRPRTTSFAPDEFHLSRFTDAEEEDEEQNDDSHSEDEYHFDEKEKKWQHRKKSQNNFSCKWFTGSSSRHVRILKNFRAQRFADKYLNRVYLLKLLKTRFPIVEWLPQYKIKDFLITDLIAGFTVGILSLPQSMAHALLASMPPVIGLYMSLFPLLIYFFLGTSKQITINAIAIVSMLSGEVIERMVHDFKYHLILSQNNVTSISPSDLSLLRALDAKAIMQESLMVNKSVIDDGIVESYRLSVACSLAFLVGIIQIILGLSGLGIIASYFSDTFVSAYTCASAFIVLVSQVKSILGLSSVIPKFVGPFKTPKTVFEIFAHLPETNWPGLGIALACMVYLIFFKEFLNPKIKKIIKFEFPSELLLVIVLTTVSYLANFEKNLGIDIVKSIPTGMPTPQVPKMSLLGQLVKDALLIAVIAFSISISLATLFSRKRRYKINPTQELYAYGTSNIFGSFFSCYPSAGSLSRSSLLDSLGANSQIASLSSSIIMIFVILWLAKLFETLPKNSLASIIIVALKGLLFQVKDLFQLWKPNKIEFITWLGTFLGVVLFDIDIGLVIGLILSILVIVIKDQYLQIRTLVEYDNRSIYVDKCFLKNSKVKHNQLLDPRAQSSPKQHSTEIHAKIFKVQNSIYFVNCESFQHKIFKKYGLSPVALGESKNSKQNELNKDVPRPQDSNKTQEESSSGSSSSNQVMIRLAETIHPSIILDFSAVNYVDTSGVKAILQLVQDYKKVDIFVYICKFQHNFVRMLYRMKKLEDFEGHLFLTIEDAFDESLSRFQKLNNSSSALLTSNDQESHESN